MLRMYDLAAAEPERRFSPYCWRSRLALAHKDLPVETIPWRFTEKEVLSPSRVGNDDRSFKLSGRKLARGRDRVRPEVEVP